MLTTLNLDRIYQFLLILLAFFLPLTVFGGNLIIVLICTIWLLSGNYKSKLNQILSSRLMKASICFFFIHFIGLMWTENLNWGMHIVHKMWYFVGLYPILFSIVKKDFIKYYIYSFLLAIALTEIFSYLVWFELIEPFKNATIENPTPFMSHVSYNPILAFSIYLVLHEIFFNKKITNLVFSFYSFFALSMSINMFITGGRAGQVAFFVMLSVLIFQFFEKQRIRSLLIIFTLIPLTFFTAYQSSDLFKKRVDIAFEEITSISTSRHNSLGLRINFNVNSFEMIKKNLLIGVGTGDFPSEYRKINEINSPSYQNTTNPHNMYTLVLSQLGIFGLLSLLSIFYYQFKFSLNTSNSSLGYSNNFFRNVGIALPILFLVIMLSDSYLLGHFTTLLFVFFSSFLHKDFEKN